MAEVVTRLADHKIPEDDISKILGVLGLKVKVIDFTFNSAQLMTTLRYQTRHLGLSLGDRACLALAIEQKLPVLTADRAWKKLKIGIEIQVIRWVVSIITYGGERCQTLA